jgi:hypothetical protein
MAPQRCVFVSWDCLQRCFSLLISGEHKVARDSKLRIGGIGVGNEPCRPSNTQASAGVRV